LVADLHRNSRHVEVNCPYHGSPRKKVERKKESDWDQEQNFNSVYMPHYFDAYMWNADKAKFKPASSLFCFIHVRVSLIKTDKTS
jgi:hypothetical protein